MELTKIFKNGINHHTNGVDNVVQKQQNQYSLHNGEKIYDLIRKEINAAHSSIYIAASWFTDYDLFNALLQKHTDNTSIEIQIILDGKKDNFYLPFKKLVDNGAKVKLIKKATPYGQMHDKFCIVDNQKLISGSYNWSKNARSNNDENVIYTEDPKLVMEFVEKFNSLLEASTDFDPENLHKIEEAEESTLRMIEADDISNYEDLITRLIYTQVHSYDENKLLEQGKDRSKKCAGDAENLLHELDNVYSGFLRDIKISNDKKEVIKLTLQEQLQRSKSEADLKARSEIGLLEKEATIQRSVIEDEIGTVKNDIALIEVEVDNIKSNQYKPLEAKLKDTDDKIIEISNSTYRPKIQLYTFIPNIVLMLLVMLYCGIFYSSAAYILIYSKDDATEAKLNGEIVKSPDIFYGDAIPRALDRGTISLIFILLVPIFIMGLIFCHK
ncbi:DUF1669 domain-containing protein [Fulvivirga sp. 29W222]|uniref:phospholipase D n=1 Tax=Fulvivirga marina TaxID=2494733 RepID=A0A937FW42_9BACT|nr:phospholipase D-like domain-containing protein [Fulvivirga marina]MBL6446098.1 DUF1669 domain-containing protein [Fulvivirga marina]